MTMTPELWARAMTHPEEFEGRLCGDLSTVEAVEGPDVDDFYEVNFLDRTGTWFKANGDHHGGPIGRNAIIRPKQPASPEPDVVAGLVEALREADDAIRRMSQYYYGRGTRGPHNGEPERHGLWEAGKRTHAALAAYEASK